MIVESVREIEGDRQKSIEGPGKRDEKKYTAETRGKTGNQREKRNDDLILE